MDKRTLLIIDEIFKVDDRKDLTCNCVRNYLKQTDHQIIFQRFPIVKNKEDFLVLDYGMHFQKSHNISYKTRHKWNLSFIFATLPYFWILFLVLFL